MKTRILAAAVGLPLLFIIVLVVQQLPCYPSVKAWIWGKGKAAEKA